MAEQPVPRTNDGRDMDLPDKLEFRFDDQEAGEMVKKGDPQAVFGKEYVVSKSAKDGDNWVIEVRVDDGGESDEVKMANDILTNMVTQSGAGVEGPHEPLITGGVKKR